MACGSESSRTLSVSGAASLVVTAASASVPASAPVPVTASVSFTASYSVPASASPTPVPGSGAPLSRARPVAAVEIKEARL